MGLRAETAAQKRLDILVVTHSGYQEEVGTYMVWHDLAVD